MKDHQEEENVVFERLTLFLLFFLLASPVLADLRIGDSAPPLSITRWVKGDALKLVAVDGPGSGDGKVHVIEFWATWCGPCLSSIPHLTKIQRKRAKDVVVIGVTKPDARNSQAAVEKFVKTQAGNMGYTVAFDGEGKTYAAYMSAARQGSIPTAFIVDRKGKLAWIGHPLRMETPLEQIIKGDYDAELAGLKLSLQARYRLLHRKGKLEEASRALSAWAALDPDDPRPLRLRFSLESQGRLETRAIETAAELIKKFASDYRYLSSIAAHLAAFDSEMARAMALVAALKAAEIAPSQFTTHKGLFIVYASMGKEKEARVAATRILQLSAGNSVLKQRLALDILKSRVRGALEDLALEAAETAAKLSSEKTWTALNLLARVQFEYGHIKEAVATQQRVIERIQNSSRRATYIVVYQKRLERYEAALAGDK